jgi:DNA-binding MarR family transcriptional regulator
MAHPSAPPEPTDGLDPVLLDPTRLAITALLSPAGWVEFGVVSQRLALAQPAVSKQAAHLERSGHLAIRKGYVGKRPRTWLTLTPDGRARLERHVEALRRIASHSATLPTAPAPDPR